MLTAFRPAAQQGISLIELMITVAIFVILALMAFPLYTTWIASQQVRTATEAVLDGLRATQGEAVKRNSAVRFVLTGGTGWQAQLVSEEKNGQFVTYSLETTVLDDSLGWLLDLMKKKKGKRK